MALWRIRLHKAVFNCAVIVYLHSALYSSNISRWASICRKTGFLGSYMENPRQNSLAIVTEQRALELVRGGVKSVFFPCLCLRHVACGHGEGRWSPHVTACLYANVCLRVFVWLGALVGVKRMRVVCSYRIKGFEPCEWTLSAMIPFNRGIGKSSKVCLFLFLMVEGGDGFIFEPL